MFDVKKNNIYARNLFIQPLYGEAYAYRSTGKYAVWFSTNNPLWCENTIYVPEDNYVELRKAIVDKALRPSTPRARPCIHTLRYNAFRELIDWFYADDSRELQSSADGITWYNTTKPGWSLSAFYRKSTLV